MLQSAPAVLTAPHAVVPSSRNPDYSRIELKTSVVLQYCCALRLTPIKGRE